MKKKLLLLSDHALATSGIATISRDLMLGTCKYFDWLQIGAAGGNPDNGKILDMSESVQKETGVSDASVRIFNNSDYGNPDLMRQVLMAENIDGIVFFTDPRYWEFLFNMEWELRQHVPLMYLNIWDNLPDPYYNKAFYASCDLLMAISKQTYGINNRVLKRSGYSSIVTYVPHGINPRLFHPIDEEPSKEFTDFRNAILGGKEYKFVLLWVNRNIVRKRPVDVIFAYREFIKKNNINKDDCLLIMHTNPIDPNGTDLVAAIDHNANDVNISFTGKQISVQELNWLYNIADCTINIADNEGFGLCTCESLMAGTPIIVNVTGGLQDQCGFINPKTGKYYTPVDYTEIGSLHDKRLDETNYGKWVTPVWPSSISTKGSIPTPYIFEDTTLRSEVAASIMHWYSKSRNERKELGKLGRDFCMNSGLNTEFMCEEFKNSIERTFNEWQPRKKWELVKTI